MIYTVKLYGIGCDTVNIWVSSSAGFSVVLMLNTTKLSIKPDVEEKRIELLSTNDLFTDLKPGDKGTVMDVSELPYGLDSRVHTQLSLLLLVKV